MGDSNENARTIFHAAIGFSDTRRREEYLNVVCEGNEQLRSQIDSLLLAYDEAGEFMESAAVGGVLTETDSCSQQIDRYKLLQRIGEGGFGNVYMAEQQTPVVRRVAIKIIKPGMDTKQVIARFEAERQALAMMEHPNIAKIYDAGQTDDGRPYFVMELVRGKPITEFCDEKRMDNGQRMRLFLDVCSAIQHAHQKGIIHRDIKPTNVLVTLHDGRPVPKVIDFGIAKATQQRLTDKTLFTRFEHFLGTPAYMSPEQAEMSGLDIDTRTDIYSAGVLLYELVTGQTPLDCAELARAGIDEVRRQIREVDPLTPSSKLSGLHRDTLATVAANRGAEVASFSAGIQRDLDWVIMKAMEKDRTRRYESAGALAEDITRCLQQEPVRAAPPSALYRLRKMARRNAAAIVTVALISAILVVATAVSTWQAIRASRLAALNAASQQEAVANLYIAEMSVAQTALAAGNIDRVKEILERYIPARGERDLRSFEWRYLWHQTHRELFSIPTDDSLFDVDIAPSGTLLATSARGGCIRVWDMDSKQQISQFQIPIDSHDEKHPLRYVFVAFSPDESLIAGCSSGTKEVVIWNLKTKKIVKRLPAGGLTGLRSVGFTPDGKRVFAGEGDSNDRLAPMPESSAGKLWMWDIQTGEPSSFQLHSDSIWCAEVSRDGMQIVTASIDGAVKILNLETEQTKEIQPPSQNGMQRARFSPDGRLVATVPRLWGTVTVWDVASGEQIKHLVFGGETINAEFSPDGKTLVVSELNCAIHLIDTQTWQPITTYYRDGIQQNMTAISPTSESIVSVGSNGKVIGWNAAPGAESKPIELAWPSSRVKFSGDSQRLVVGTANGAIHVYDLSTRLRTAVLAAPEDAREDSHRFEFEFFSVNPNGRHIACLTADDEQRVDVWNAETQQIDFRLQHVRGVTIVAYAADESVIVTGTSVDGSGRSVIRFWDAKTGKDVGRSISQTAPIGCLALSSDASLIAVSLTEKMIATGAPTSAFGASHVFIYDVASGQQIATLKGHTSAVGDIKSLEFSHDGALLATAGYDRQVILWDTKTWSPTASLLGHTNQLNDLSFSRDGFRLASSADDGVVILWDIKTQREVAQFRGSHMEFSPDGTALAIGAAGGAAMHSDHILGPDGAFLKFKDGSEYLTVRIYRAPRLDEEADATK
ncbi:MAG: serine/threonine-protein kinase [Pirellulaceae bacterium]